MANNSKRKGQIVNLYSQGVPVSEIAKKLRISEAEVVWVLVKEGLLRD